MRLRGSDILGLGIGFLLGGIALVFAAPWLDPAPQPPPAEGAAPLPAIITPSHPVQSRFPTSRPSPDRPPLDRQSHLPAIPAPIAPPASRLPAIIGPSEPESGVGGTGFFIAPDGMLLTAAHVAGACRQRKVVSPFVPLAAADVLAIDPKHDLALLQARRVRVPAMLPLADASVSYGADVSGDQGQAGRPVELFGYPAGSDPRAPTPAEGRLRELPLPLTVPVTMPQPGTLADIVWVEAGGVAKGFSGGPVLDRRRLAVVGMIQGIFDPDASRRLFGPGTARVATGPSARQINAFLQREVPWLDPALTPPAQTTADQMRAIVHVLCFR